MSRYNFFPRTNTNREEPYVYWENGFVDEDISRIIDIGDSLGINTATIDKDNFDSSLRRSKTSWIANNIETTWLYEKLEFITSNLNSQYYNFDLTGFLEHFQYTVYESSEEGHYNWHSDSGTETQYPRKLSLVVQLSDPSEYEGGELQIMKSSNIMTVRKEKGFVVAFPSYTIHRVTPVTAGIRRSLVVWTTGPHFR